MSGVFDPFMLRVKIAFFVGLIVSCPVWLYQVGRSSPWACTGGRSLGLPVRGDRGAAVRGGCGAGLRGDVPGLVPAWPDAHGVPNLPSIDTYLSYFQGMILGFGLAFELPWPWSSHVAPS